MAHSITEILISYAFVITLCVGLLAVVLAIVFLPDLMRTTAWALLMGRSSGMLSVPQPSPSQGPIGHSHGGGQRHQS